MVYAGQPNVPRTICPFLFRLVPSADAGCKQESGDAETGGGDFLSTLGYIRGFARDIVGSRLLHSQQGQKRRRTLCSHVRRILRRHSIPLCFYDEPDIAGSGMHRQAQRRSYGISGYCRPSQCGEGICETYDALVGALPLTGVCRLSAISMWPQPRLAINRGPRRRRPGAGAGPCSAGPDDMVYDDRGRAGNTEWDGDVTRRF